MYVVIWENIRLLGKVVQGYRIPSYGKASGYNEWKLHK